MSVLADHMEIYASRQAAADAAAHALAAAVDAELARSAHTSLIVSGGSTPTDCFRALARMPLPWSRVRIALTDERLVAPTDPASNERLVRCELMQHCASAAQFVRLEAEQVGTLPRPFAAVLLGMGEDGHFASIFPAMPNRAAALQPDNSELLVEARASAPPMERVSMTLACLRQTRETILLAFGAAKRRVLEAPEGLPVAALAEQGAAPLRILWAP